MAVELTDTNFKSTVLDSDKVAIVDFWAPWCEPCLAIAPIIEDLARDCEQSGKAIVGKLDIDENPETTDQYNIMGVPTILFIKNEQVVDKQLGGAPKSELLAILSKHIS